MDCEAALEQNLRVRPTREILGARAHSDSSEMLGGHAGPYACPNGLRASGLLDVHPVSVLRATRNGFAEGKLLMAGLKTRERRCLRGLAGADVFVEISKKIEEGVRITFG